MSKAETIDAYFREKDYFPHVPYEPIGAPLVEEALPAGVGVATVAAVVEGESGGKNLMHHDADSILHGRAVDKQMVDDLLKWIDLGGRSNGVGVTAITWPDFIREAHYEMGGCHLIRIQLRMGCRILAAHIGRYGLRGGLAAYNGGAGNPNYAYADKILGFRDEWRVRLA